MKKEVPVNPQFDCTFFQELKKNRR
jgi:hypothetical protein